MADAAGIGRPFNSSTGFALSRTPLLVRPSQPRRPNFHGRHNEIGNALWLDGHVKAMKPVYKTVAFGFTGPEDYRRFFLGDLVKPGTLPADDYYFKPNKQAPSLPPP